MKSRSIAIVGLALCASASTCYPRLATAAGETSATPAAPAPAGAAPGEAPAARQELERELAALNESGAQLEQLRDRFERSNDERKVLLAPELMEKRSAYLRQLNGVADRLAADDSQGMTTQRAPATASVSQALSKEGARLLRDLEHELERVNSLITRDTATAEDLDQLDAARKASLDSLPALFSDADLNLKARASLEQDTSQQREQLKQLLTRSATLTGSLLRTVSDSLDKLKAKSGAKPSEEDQALRERLLGYRELLAQLQHKNLDLMDSYGIDTVQRRQDLIRATGEVSQDILNAKVASGLLSKWTNDAIAWTSERASGFIVKVISCVLIVLLFVGLARVARRIAERTLGRSKQMSSLASDFFVKLSARVVLVIGLLIAAATIGIEVGPLLAGLGIAGFVLGFALQETLSNFAAGMMILVYRPFDIGDVIEAAGVSGAVQDMTLVSTSVVTFDNQMLVVPNSKIWGGVIRNVTHLATRRVDLQFGIGYADDVQHATRVLNDIVRQHPKVLADPAPVVRVHELGESSVKFVVRPWVKTADYWDVYWDLTLEVKSRFDAEGISFPFPQRAVHVYSSGDSRPAMHSEIVPINKQA